MREYSQGQSKSEEIGEVVLDERKTSVQFPALIVPLVFESIQRVQQAHVCQTDRI